LKFFLKNTKVRFLPNNFFYGQAFTIDEDIRKGTKAIYPIVLEIKPLAKHIGDFPATMIFEAIIPHSPRGKYRGNVSRLLAWLAEDFISEDPQIRDFPVNILIWGGMGDGKSSFINGIINLFRGKQNVHKELVTFRSDQHVTTQYSCNDIALQLDDSVPVEKLVRERLKLRLWDPWGVSEVNYKRLSVVSFVEGRLRADSDMNDNECNSDVIDENKIHAVIVIIPIGTAQDDSKLKLLEKHIRQILDKKIRPIIVINYIKTVKNEEELMENKNKILDASHLDSNDIFLHDNYVDENYRQMSTDLKYREILLKAFNEAIKNMKKKNNLLKGHQY